MKKLAFLLALVATCGNAMSQVPVMVTFAGNGTGGITGDGGPATAAEFFTPSGVFADTAGNIYITDQNANCVRKVNTAGIVSTIAGTCGSSGYSGDGGPATAAKLYWPEGVAVERNGNVYIADQFNEVIRKVSMATGAISTIAGNNTVGYTGDGGSATDATLWHPADVAVDYAGNVFFVDQDNSCVRKVAASTGIITTVAGNGTAGYTGDGIPGTAAELNFPQGIATDSAGNVYIADFYNNRIRRLSTAGIITTVAGNGTGGFSGDGSPATAAELYNASAVTVDSRGQVFISDYYNSMIRRIDTAGIITTLGGNDTAGYRGDCGPATSAEIYYPEGVAADKRGNVYIADFGNHRVRMITLTPCSTTAVDEVRAGKVTLLPNPSAGKFSIAADDHTLVFDVAICNSTGVCVYHNSVQAGQEIDLRQYPDGIYFARIRNGTGYSYEKIGVTH